MSYKLDYRCTNRQIETDEQKMKRKEHCTKYHINSLKDKLTNRT